MPCHSDIYFFPSNTMKIHKITKQLPLQFASVKFWWRLH